MLGNLSMEGIVLFFTLKRVPCDGFYKCIVSPLECCEGSYTFQRVYELNSGGFDFTEITLEGFGYDLHITLYSRGVSIFLPRGGIAFMLTSRPVLSGALRYRYSRRRVVIVA